MKKLAYLSILILLVSPSCKKLLTFDISDQTTITIENIFPIDLPFDIPTPNITTNSEQEFENNDTKIELVKEIILKEIELAWKDNISSSTQKIQLETTGKTLDKYVKSSSYKLRTQAVTKEIMLHDVDILIDLTFQVTADIL